jgi:hypothetical protein
MNLDEITEGTLNSPAELMDFYETFQPIGPQKDSQTPLPPISSWAFRGQSQPFGTLLPSFQRIFEMERSIGAAEIIEADLLKTFREHYRSLKDRTYEMPSSDSIGNGYDLRCLSVMQHYGVPTRLLDWTSNFWTALYFACAAESSKDAEIWFYDRAIFEWQKQSNYSSLLNPIKEGTTQNLNTNYDPVFLSLRGRHTLVEFDPQMTPRMREQSGHHTLSTDMFSDHVQLLYELSTPLSAITPNDQKRPFGRVLISSKCKEKTIRFLSEQLKVTASTIFPDVEGLGKFLHWHLESLVNTIL